MAKARVLLVEDDDVQANATRATLLKSGYEVLWARDGIGAIKQAKTSNPDIILLDLVLPGLNGHEVCRWLKAEETTKGIPVIMLSEKKEISDKVSGLEIGADDYLPKPYNELELIARIYASLRTKALQDELRMKNMQLEELLGKVEVMAITDALTGLFNRRKFIEVLSKEFEKARRYSTPFSVIMIDIDFFKNINDNYGHQTGDAVLKEVADIISKSIREIDIAARYGGEEFVVVLPNTDREYAKVNAERVRTSISSCRFPEVSHNITASFGISGLPDSMLVNQDKLLRCADFALYRAKQNGRNRVEVAEGRDLEKKV